MPDFLWDSAPETKIEGLVPYTVTIVLFLKITQWLVFEGINFPATFLRHRGNFKDTGVFVGKRVATNVKQKANCSPGRCWLLSTGPERVISAGRAICDKLPP